MKKLLFLFIFLVFLPVISSAETINGLEVGGWDSTDYTLSWANPSISKGDYVIKVTDFNWKGDTVVSVTRKGVTQKGVLSQGENTIFDFTKNTTYFQGVKIYAKTVSNFLPLPTNIGTYPCCPAAEITVSVSKDIAEKKPALELVLSLNWDGRSGVASTMKVEIKNTGDADFYEGNVTINISGLKIANEKELSDYALTYNPLKEVVTRGWSTPLLASNSYNINLSIKPPAPPDPNKTKFTIKVESYFKNFNGKVYPATASATVSVNPTVELTKRITPSTIFGEKRYGEGEIDIGFLPKFFGLGKVTVVNIYVKNRQSYAVKSVILNETIMDGFRLIDYTTPPTQGFKLMDNDTKLQWAFDLNASETKEFRYELTSQKTGTFKAPAAVATWNELGSIRTASSDQPTTRVYGVFVVVSKRTDQTRLKLNERLNVTVNLENIGDFPVGLNVTDILPKNTTFISGETTYSGFLYPKESVVLRYNLSADYPGELGFPSPQLTFWKKDYEGAYGFIPASNITVFESSETLPDVTAINPAITPTSAQTPPPKSLIDIIGEKAPWLEGAIPIIMLFVAIILMLLLHVINR
ncbi:MAG: hypothetical protein WC568_06345 [Candidatus Methanoperedens sp.]